MKDNPRVAAGGKTNGTLDFYEVHYYTSNGASDSCFTYPASHWALDKKLVDGDLPAAATDGTAPNDLYTKIFSNRPRWRVGMVLRFRLALAGHADADAEPLHGADRDNQ